MNVDIQAIAGKLEAGKRLAGSPNIWWLARSERASRARGHGLAFGRLNDETVKAYLQECSASRPESGIVIAGT